MSQLHAVTLAALCGVAASTIACHDPDHFTLSPTDVGRMFSLTPLPASMPADGVSRTTITATIDGNAAADARTVEFATTLGQFVGRNDRTASVTADSNGHAAVVLMSEAVVGTAIVTATIKRGTTVLLEQTTTVPFVPPVADLYFSVTLDRSSVPADGFSEVRATVSTNLTNTQGRKTFEFSATDGSFVASGGGSTPELKPVVADDTGKATAVLRSSTRPGANSIRVKLAEINVVADTPILFTPIRIDDQIKLTVSNTSPPADTATVTRVTAQLPPGGIDRAVTFTATGATISGSATANPDGTAVAFLTSPARPVTSEITATANGFTARTQVTFVRALPDRILVQPAAPSITPGLSTPVHIDVNLLRDVGKVTDETLVKYEGIHENGQSVGIFSSVALSQNGASSANMVVPATTPPGKITIRVTVPDSVAVGTATIVIP